MIAKSISAGQNLEVKETTYEPLRLSGAYVEDELDDDDDDVASGEGEVYDEKQGLSEKVVEIVAGEVTSEKVPVDGAADSLL
jgi:vacuolar protein sorting-associated protein 3